MQPNVGVHMHRQLTLRRLTAYILLPACLTVPAATVIACGSNAGEPETIIFHVSGTYRWEDGVGLRNIRVVASSSWREFDGRFVLAEDTTDANGEYSLEWTGTCPPPAYYINAFFTSGWRQSCTSSSAVKCDRAYEINCTLSPEGICSPRPPHLPQPECADSPMP